MQLGNSEIAHASGSAEWNTDDVRETKAREARYQAPALCLSVILISGFRTIDLRRHQDRAGYNPAR